MLRVPVETQQDRRNATRDGNRSLVVFIVGREVYERATPLHLHSLVIPVRCHGV
jgi:hypothetical protein